jgi:hypothetical protein
MGELPGYSVVTYSELVTYGVVEERRVCLTSYDRVIRNAID